MYSFSVYSGSYFIRTDGTFSMETSKIENFKCQFHHMYGIELYIF